MFRTFQFIKLKKLKANQINCLNIEWKMLYCLDMSVIQGKAEYVFGLLTDFGGKISAK